VIVINVGTTAATVSLSGLTNNARYAAVLPTSAAALQTDAAGVGSVTIPAQSTIVFGR
jgi:hypothetical protein